jgi:hypothetical protein
VVHIVTTEFEGLRNYFYLFFFFFLCRGKETIYRLLRQERKKRLLTRVQRERGIGKKSDKEKCPLSWDEERRALLSCSGSRKRRKDFSNNSGRI